MFSISRDTSFGCGLRSARRRITDKLPHRRYHVVPPVTTRSRSKALAVLDNKNTVLTASSNPLPLNTPCSSSILFNIVNSLTVDSFIVIDIHTATSHNHLPRVLSVYGNEVG